MAEVGSFASITLLIVKAYYKRSKPIRQIIWKICFEYITDFEYGDSERISGTLKPTRFAKLIDRICIGKPIK